MGGAKYSWLQGMQRLFAAVRVGHSEMADRLHGM
jgi:hypothetical protein